MKKYLSFLLALSLALSAFSVTAFSDAETAVPTLTIGSAEETVPGDSIVIPVTFTGNTYGVSNYGIEITYDTTYLTYTGYDLTDSIYSGYVTDGNMPEGSILLTSMSTDNSTGDGVLFKLMFTVNDTTETNVSTDIAFADTDALQLEYINETNDNIDYRTLDLVYEEGSVTINVTDEPVVDPDEPVVDDTDKGDIDGSGEITANDAAALLKYVIGGAANDEWHVSTAVADVNGDGSVTAEDAALILEKVLNVGVSFS